MEMMAMACEPCEGTEEEEEQTDAPAVADRAATGERPSGAPAEQPQQQPPPPQPWWRMFSADEQGCECCDTGDGNGEATSNAAASAAASGEAQGAAQLWTGQQQRTALGGAFRQLAWLVHAMIDGMVIVSVPSTTLLVPAAFAVLVCALQDSLAFCVLLARADYSPSSSPRALCVALTLFSLSFPAGAAIASLATRYSQQQGGDEEVSRGAPLNPRALDSYACASHCPLAACSD